MNYRESTPPKAADLRPSNPMDGTHPPPPLPAGPAAFGGAPSRQITGAAGPVMKSEHRR